MGKPTGFMDYKREGNPATGPLERIKTYREFHAPLDERARREQASRCMNCGVPFCQYGKPLNGMISGCPLNNLCPDWNDLLYKGFYREAYERLSLTNCFPEFTSRVCPALCEKACTCGLDDEPVTVRENEYTIIEHAFAQGMVRPELPALRSGKRVAVVGSGPSGLSCAYWLNRHGHSVTVYERDDEPGGLLMYGIPAMKLEKNIVHRRIDLMKESGISFVCNCNVGKDITADELCGSYDAVVLAGGSKNARDIKAPGRDCDGIYFAVDFLKATTRSLLHSNLSDGYYISAKYKDVGIVGGGDTGNDCLGTAIRHGAKSVTQLEMNPAPPISRTPGNPWPEWPRILKTDYGQEEAIAVFGHDPRIYNTTVKRFIPDGGKIKAIETVGVEFVQDPATGRRAPHQIPGSEKIIPADLVLISAGVTGPEADSVDAFVAQFSKDAHSTSIPGIFTAGDMHIGQSLVVRAIREGKDCAEEICTFLKQN